MMAKSKSWPPSDHQKLMFHAHYKLAVEKIAPCILFYGRVEVAGPFPICIGDIVLGLCPLVTPKYKVI